VEEVAVAVRTSLARTVREKLELGALPFHNPATLRAGSGTGRACSVCGYPIQPSQTEIQPRYDENRSLLVFHIVCHGLWDAERRRRRYRSHD
jgi:hypothetical protein